MLIQDKVCQGGVQSISEVSIGEFKVDGYAVTKNVYYPETGVAKSAKTFLHNHNNSTIS